MQKFFSSPLSVRWMYLNISHKMALTLVLEACIRLPIIAGFVYGMHHWRSDFEFYDLLFWGSCIMLATILITTFVHTMLYRIIIRPMRILSSTVGKIREGEYDIECHLNANDEFGMCVDTLTVLAKNIQEMITDREWQTQIMSTMFKVLTTITDTAQDEQALLNKILYEIHDVLEYDVATICVYHDDHTLVLTNRVGDTTSSCIGTCIDMNPLCAVDQVLQRRTPILLEYPKLPCYQVAQNNPKSWLGVPIIMSDKTIGVVSLEHRTHMYSKESIVLLQAVASQIAAVLTHYRYVETLKQTNHTLQQERRMFVNGFVIMFKWQNAKGWPVEYVSPNVVGTFGYTANEFMSGQVVYAELIPIEDAKRVGDEVKQVIENPDIQHFEHAPYRIVSKDGTHKWLYDFTTVIRDEHGTPTHFLGYVLDITDKRKAESLLQRLKQAIETVEVGVTITDIDGTIVYTNPAEATMHGYTKPLALIGQPANILGDPKLRDAEARKHMDEQKKHILDNGENFMRESRNAQRNGTIFPVYLISSRLYNEHDEYIGTITVSENISERKQVELQLKHQNQELDMMAKTLAHDLMNPARGLEGMSDILINEYADKLGEDGQNICKLINKYAVRMARMIEASRQHARAAEQIDVTPISSLSPIRWAIDQLNYILDNVEIDVPKNSHVIQADLTQIGRVFQNLFENAVKFSNAVAPRITVKQIPHGRMLEYQVIDNGMGIAPRYQEKIFYLFHQIDPKDSKSQQGMGAGLAIVKKIIEKHGGSIRVLSPADPQIGGSGTIFSFTIPLSTPHVHTQIETDRVTDKEQT